MRCPLSRQWPTRLRPAKWIRDAATRNHLRRIAASSGPARPPDPGRARHRGRLLPRAHRTAGERPTRTRPLRHPRSALFSPLSAPRRATLLSQLATQLTEAATLPGASPSPVFREVLDKIERATAAGRRDWWGSYSTLHDDLNCRRSADSKCPSNVGEQWIRPLNERQPLRVAVQPEHHWQRAGWS